MNGEKNIIIAEDEADLREIYSRTLQSRGFRVLVAENGEEAIEELEGNQGMISAVLLDILMPKMDGFDALEKIRSNEDFKQIKVIMLTNLDSPEDRQRAIELGADDFLVKSQYSPSQLAEQIIKILS
jgi:two-component system, chemotaxis family, sensor kinase CheA